MNHVSTFAFLHRMQEWFRRTSGFMKVVVSAIVSATLTLSILLFSTQITEAWVIGDCQFEEDSIDPILYKYMDVETDNRTAFNLAQNAWDFSAAAGEFQIAGSSDTPEMIVIWFGFRQPETSLLNIAGTVGKPYYSIEELSVDADVIVLGTVNGVIAREVDYGKSGPGDPSSGTGIPTVFYGVTVVDTLKGSPSTHITVAGLDRDAIGWSSAEETPLISGQQVLLFLEEVTKDEAPGISSFDLFYVALGDDHGVFDKQDNGNFAPRRTTYFDRTEFSAGYINNELRP